MLHTHWAAVSAEVAERTAKVKVEDKQPAVKAEIAVKAKKVPGLTGKQIFLRNSKTWKARALLDVSRPKLGSWLISASTGDRWGMGCRVCKAAPGRSSSWKEVTVANPKLVRWSKIVRHSQSKLHRAAVETYLLTASPSTSLPVSSPAAVLTPTQKLMAPEVSQFATVLEGKLKGQSHNAASGFGHGRLKTTWMAWCLGEAVKQQQQVTLGKCSVIALRQDASNGRLLVRCTAIDGQLNRRPGLFGVAQNFGTKSQDTYKATMTVLRNFCHRHLAPPGRPQRAAESMSSSTRRSSRASSRLTRTRPRMSRELAGCFKDGRLSVLSTRCCPI